MSNKNINDKELELLDVHAESSQLSLFEIAAPSFARRNDLSQTIDIYDALPKYVWEQTREFNDLSNALVTRRCTIRGNQYVVKIKPAMIQKEDRTVLIYPGQREELVEDVLRKIAVGGGANIIEGGVGVLFTLTDLRKELADTGHTLSLDEIKESLLVCRGAILECHSSDGYEFISSNFFPMLGLTTRGKYLAKGGDARCYVQFNPMVTDSINKLTFRQYSYKAAMKLRSPLARYIYKRMSHYWTQAAPDAPYTPSLTSFLSQSPRGLSERMAENTRAMKNALDVLIKEGILSDYDTEQVLDRRKLIDVRYTIRPSENFVKQAKAANHQSKQMLLKDLKQRTKMGKSEIL